MTLGIIHPMPTTRRLRPPTSSDTTEVSPGRRATALAIDLIYGGLASLLALLVAMLWLLVRTAWGRDDVPTPDATAAAALLLAATPAWLAWTALRLVQRGATPGQARAGLRVTGRPRQRLLRFALHPLAVPGWLWLALLAGVATFNLVALACATVGLALLLGGLATAALAVLRPTARGFHDRATGTRLVRA